MIEIVFPSHLGMCLYSCVFHFCFYWWFFDSIHLKLYSILYIFARNVIQLVMIKLFIYVFINKKEPTVSKKKKSNSKLSCMLVSFICLRMHDVVSTFLL